MLPNIEPFTLTSGALAKKIGPFTERGQIDVVRILFSAHPTQDNIIFERISTDDSTVIEKYELNPTLIGTITNYVYSPNTRCLRFRKGEYFKVSWLNTDDFDILTGSHICFSYDV